MGASRPVLLASVVLVALVIASAAGYEAIVSSQATPCSSDYPCTSSTESETVTTTVSQVANQTVVAVYASTIASPPATTASTSVSATSLTTSGRSTTVESSVTSTQAPPPSGAFTYSPGFQVRVLSVSARVSQGQSGPSGLSFSVQFENIGSGPIYVLGGGGSSLSVTSLSGNAVSNQTEKLRCEIPVATVPLNPGQNFTSVTPGCWSGYTYVLSQPETIEVQLTLSWSTGYSAGAQQGSTEINAEFTLP